MYFPLDNCIGLKECRNCSILTLVENKVARINTCFDHTLSTMFGEDWKAQEEKWKFARAMGVVVTGKQIIVSGDLSTPFNSKDHEKVNKAILSIKDGREVAKNRKDLVASLEEEQTGPPYTALHIPISGCGFSFVVREGLEDAINNFLTTKKSGAGSFKTSGDMVYLSSAAQVKTFVESLEKAIELGWLE